jgi:hypothetical protein
MSELRKRGSRMRALGVSQMPPIVGTRVAGSIADVNDTELLLGWV